jgi:hypothetical protein
MSTLRTNLLADLAGTNSPDVTRGEFVRCRFNLNGTGTIAARDTFNVSSFTDSGVGYYVANYSTAFPNNTYSFMGGAITPGALLGFLIGPILADANQSTTSIAFGPINTSFASADMTHCEALIVGDK